VVAAIAQAAGVAEMPDQPLLDGVIGQLAGCSMLLVLDNLEQVQDAGPAIGCLLEEAPSVSVLVTSREPLMVYGEQVYRVPALPLPDLTRINADEAGVARVLAESPAVALFDQRARGAHAGWVLTADQLPAVAELCHRLDGLPLAIELAAARTDRLRPTELLEHLVGHLDALGDGPRNRPQRQQSLRGAIDWSIALLDADDRRLFESLGVFAGGFTLAAAHGVGDYGAPESTAEDDSLALKTLAARLAQLVNKSLLVAEPAPDGTPRYRMLKTIHAHAKVRLSLAGGADRARGRHLAHYVAVSAEAAAGMAGPDQAEWAERLRWEYANLRAAMEWALEHDDGAAAGRVCMGLWRYWRNGGHILEGREWLHKVLSAPGALSDQERTHLLYPAAVLAATQDDTEAAARFSQECLHLSGRVGDRRSAAQARNILGVTALALGHADAAGEHFRFSLDVWQDLDEPAGMAIALGNLAKVALRLGDIPTASDDINRCLALERAAGNSRGVLLGLECLGEILLAKGDLPAARANCAEALTLARELGDVFGEAMALHQSGLVAQAEGNTGAALELFLGALERRHEVGDREDLAVSLDSVAELTVADDPRLAVELLSAVHALRRRSALATPPDGEARRAGVLAAARAALGEQPFAAAWQAGGTAPLDLVVDRALDSAAAR
jgi:predicted ATPase